MKWIISHQSALEFWRESPVKEALAEKKVQTKRVSTRPMDAKEFCAKAPFGLSMPLHVLVGSENARKVSRRMKSHISSGQYPSGSFIHTKQGAIVSSPELCFMQMASELSFVELVVLGFEFCGTYRLDCTGIAERGFRDDQPLTSVTQLDSFITKAVSLKGRTKAKKALRFIADNSASPMETSLTILLTMPYRYGGYGFSLPQLNYRVDIVAQAGKKTSRARFYCDLFWMDAKVDLEYDSEAFHARSDQIAKDSKRRNTLLSLGITVITVSWMQIAQTAELHTIAEMLSKRLKKRLICPKGFSVRQALLRQQVLPKLSESRY